MRLFEKINNNEVYIIAEMSANHGGDINNAIRIVHAAKQAGGDCLKVQTYTADTLTIPCDNDYFRITKGLWKGRTLYDLYRSAFMPWEWQEAIKNECLKCGLDFLSTPYDKSAVDFLEDLDAEFYKIASFEIVDLPLIEYAASKGKPLIMSCGMASQEEIREALEAAYSQGNHDVVLLKCCSEYPANYSDMNLAIIADMKERFKVPIGFSDHSAGSIAAVTAVSLGACVIEKHLCLSREIKTVDSAFSMEPDEFEQMVKDVRRTKEIIGQKTYELSAKEKESIIFRRSVFAVKDIQEGEAFTDNNLRVIRPGYGLKPKYFRSLLGTRAGKPVKRGEPILFDSLIPGSIIFLTNNGVSMKLYEWLRERENVFLYNGKLTPEMVNTMKPSLIISYCYKHIISGEVISLIGGRIINLHISLLPWNRGASPNFFSFYEDTPKGVTIHMIDKGIDTGDILCQKEIRFDEEGETFESSYLRLNDEIQKLFCDNWEAIKAGGIKSVKQPSEGTSHTKAQLEGVRRELPFEWSDNIAGFKKKYGI